MVITAEGAIWEGAQIADVGDDRRVRPPAQGEHRRGRSPSELKARTGIEAVASDLTYDLRSGEPDMLDSMVASTFANIAMDLIRDGIGGRMTAIRDGKYSHVSLAETAKPPRRVQLDAYDTERFRPKYARPPGRSAAADAVAGAGRQLTARARPGRAR